MKVYKLLLLSLCIITNAEAQLLQNWSHPVVDTFQYVSPQYILIDNNHDIYIIKRKITLPYDYCISIDKFNAAGVKTDSMNLCDTSFVLGEVYYHTYKAAIDEDNNLIVSGFSDDDIISFIAKFDADLNFVNEFVPPYILSPQSPIIADFALLQNGNILAVGKNMEKPYYLLLDSTMDTIWTRYFTDTIDTTSVYEYNSRILKISENKFVIQGQIDNIGFSGKSPITYCIDTTGQALWVHYYPNIYYNYILRNIYCNSDKSILAHYEVGSNAHYFYRIDSNGVFLGDTLIADGIFSSIVRGDSIIYFKKHFFDMKMESMDLDFALQNTSLLDTLDYINQLEYDNLYTDIQSYYVNATIFQDKFLLLGLDHCHLLSPSTEYFTHDFMHYIGLYAVDSAYLYIVTNRLASNYTLKQYMINPVAISEYDAADNSMIVSPNPCYDMITITSDIQHATYTIYDVKGQLLIQSTAKNIDIHHLPQGMYFVTATDNKRTYSTKFVKR